MDWAAPANRSLAVLVLFHVALVVAHLLGAAGFIGQPVDPDCWEAPCPLPPMAYVKMALIVAAPVFLWYPFVAWAAAAGRPWIVRIMAGLQVAHGAWFLLQAMLFPIWFFMTLELYPFHLLLAVAVIAQGMAGMVRAGEGSPGTGLPTWDY